MDTLTVSGKSVHDLKVTELKDELGKRALSKSGNKQQLLSRLCEFLLENPETPTEHVPVVPPAPVDKALVGDNPNPFIAQYLADRETQLQASLDHKRKVQAVTAEHQAEEEAPAENAENTDMPVQEMVVISAAVQEEDTPPLASGSSRRKQRKPDYIRKSGRTGSPGASEEPEIAVDVAATASTVAGKTGDLHKSPTTVRSPSNLNSGVKEELGSPHTVVEKPPAAIEQSAVTQPVVPPSQLVVKEMSNKKMVSREASAEIEVMDGGTSVAELKVEKTATSDPTTIVQAGARSSMSKSPLPAGALAEKPKDHKHGPVSPPSKHHVAEAKKDTDSVVSSDKITRRTRSSVPRGEKEVSKPVTAVSRVEEPKATAASAAVTVSDEKSGLALPRKLQESLSIEEEKLDYGEIEVDDDGLVKDEAPSSAKNVEAPQTRKRRGTERSDSIVVSSDTINELFKQEETTKPEASEGAPKVIREPPRKMARFGLGGAREDLSLARSISQIRHEKPPTSPPASRLPASRMLHIRNLVRPYTVPVLKELLKKTGTIVDDAEHFWIDGIKSQCIVTYVTEEEAEATRKALYNLIWPPSNTRQLVVDFMKEEEFKERTTAPSTPITSAAPTSLDIKRPTGTGARPHIDRPTVEKLKITVASNKETGEAQRDVAIARGEERRAERREKEREKEKESLAMDTEASPPKKEAVEKVQEREWDRGKEVPVPKEETKPTEEAPARTGPLLEVLFQRTETRPQLYWKPLTDEQVKAKAEENQRNEIERDDRRKQTEQDRRQRGLDEPKTSLDRSRRDSDRRGIRNESPRRRSRSRDRGGFGGANRSAPVASSYRRRPSPVYERRRSRERYAVRGRRESPRRRSRSRGRY